jgi:hypothetical protein
MVPVNALAFIIAHAGEQHASGLSLFDNVFDYLRTPVIVFSVFKRVSSNIYSIRRAEDSTAMAADAVFLTTSYLDVIGIVIVHIKAALIATNLALDTPGLVPFY